MKPKDLIPPVAYRKLVAWRAGRNPVFETYDQALAAAGEGYADTALAEVVFQKTQRLVAASPREALGDAIASSILLAISTAAAESPARPLRVMDFGGAFGTAYFLVKEVLQLDCRWAVVESPTFAAQGRGLEDASLKFFDDMEAAKAWLGEVDLLYSSSTLQYLSDPETMLRSLLTLGAGRIAWIRTAFSTGRRFVELQSSRLQDNGPGSLPDNVTDRLIRYPRTYLKLADFVAEMEREYELVLRYNDGEGASWLGGLPILMDERFLYRRRAS